MAWDDLWLGVICQTNLEIAGSPRDIFRYSPVVFLLGVELLDRSGARKCVVLNQTPNTVVLEYGSETAGDKLRRREGNSPDHQLRPLSVC